MIELLRLESDVGVLERTVPADVIIGDEALLNLVYQSRRAIRVAMSPGQYGPVAAEVWDSLWHAATDVPCLKWSGGGGSVVAAVSSAQQVAAAGYRALKVASAATTKASAATAAISEARLKGYTGDTCGECGGFTVRRKGTCLACDCGWTGGCG